MALDQRFDFWHGQGQLRALVQGDEPLEPFNFLQMSHELRFRPGQSGTSELGSCRALLQPNDVRPGLFAPCRAEMLLNSSKYARDTFALRINQGPSAAMGTNKVCGGMLC